MSDLVAAHDPKEPPAYVRRRPRREQPRAKVTSHKRMRQLVEEAGPAEYSSDMQRPRTRGECVDGPRPCPWVSCKHHMYLDVVGGHGSIKINFPHLEMHELPETCSLDVADRGPQTLDKVGKTMNITRERVRQIELGAMGTMRTAAPELDEGDG